MIKIDLDNNDDDFGPDDAMGGIVSLIFIILIILHFLIK
jgi:hypothetical protein